MAMFPGYLPPNQAHCILFGNPKHSVESWSMIDIDGQRLFNSHEELVNALARKGLRIVKVGIESRIEPDCTNRKASFSLS